MSLADQEQDQEHNSLRSCRAWVFSGVVVAALWLLPLPLASAFAFALALALALAFDLALDLPATSGG
ncbi:hypothetical protein ACX3YG_09450 [Pseudomonas wadenswilerensis]